jgi:hypothetical protein
MEAKSELKKTGAESTPLQMLFEAKVPVSHRKRRLNVRRLRNTNGREVWNVSHEEHA